MSEERKKLADFINRELTKQLLPWSREDLNKEHIIHAVREVLDNIRNSGPIRPDIKVEQGDEPGMVHISFPCSPEMAAQMAYNLYCDGRTHDEVTEQLKKWGLGEYLGTALIEMTITDPPESRGQRVWVLRPETIHMTVELEDVKT
jgi:hypothetical protein